MGQFINNLQARRSPQQGRHSGLRVAPSRRCWASPSLAAVAVGTLLARSAQPCGSAELAVRHAAASARATSSVRVSEVGHDEISALARAFNRMLGEVETSRARIEYLQRISAWQEMARRLAHEIKNPLTPISSRVQEIHRRYQGRDAQFRRLLDTTLEVVEDEVGTLRRLVSEFSDFARLPQAQAWSARICGNFWPSNAAQIEGGDESAWATSSR